MMRTKGYFLLKSRTGFYTYSLEAPYCAFCTFGCGLLFGLQSFLFFFLVPLPGVFSFIYLFIFYIMLLLGSWLIKSNLTDTFFFLHNYVHFATRGGGLMMGGDHATKMVNCKVMPKKHWHCHLHQFTSGQKLEHKQDNKTAHATLGGDNDNISHYQCGLGTKPWSWILYLELLVMHAEPKNQGM
jgi:hypothetical protein